MSNEMLEQNIAAIYYEGYQVAPGRHIEERKNPILEGLWREFELRLKEGTISPETDWEPRKDWED